MLLQCINKILLHFRFPLNFRKLANHCWHLFQSWQEKHPCHLHRQCPACHPIRTWACYELEHVINILEKIMDVEGHSHLQFQRAMVSGENGKIGDSDFQEGWPNSLGPGRPLFLCRIIVDSPVSLPWNSMATNTWLGNTLTHNLQHDEVRFVIGLGDDDCVRGVRHVLSVCLLRGCSTSFLACVCPRKLWGLHLNGTQQHSLLYHLHTSAWSHAGRSCGHSRSFGTWSKYCA